MAQRNYYFKFFAGAVPAGTIFKMSVDDTRDLIEHGPAEEWSHTIYELCVVGIVAYFEAFLRDHFASLINIQPPLVRSLAARGRDVQVDASAFVDTDDALSCQLGFLLAERFEFGTPRSANSLYAALIGVTPFNTKERRKYEDLLNDRNLLVHHGGIFTRAHSGQTFFKRQVKRRVYFDSLVVQRKDALDLVEGIVKKTMQATQQRLLAEIKSTRKKLSATVSKAIEALTWFP